GLDGWLKTGDMALAYALRARMLGSTGVRPFYVDDYEYPGGKDRINCPSGYLQPPRKTGKYRPGTESHGFKAWNNQHFTCIELADGWRLFGNPLALDSVKKIGVYNQFFVDWRKQNKQKNPRNDSRPWYNLCEEYRITGDPGMLQAIKDWEKIAWENQIDKVRGHYAFKKVPANFSALKGVKVDGKANVAIGETWPHCVLIDGMQSGYRITGNENVPDMILGMTDYVLEEAFLGWPHGFAYKIPLDPVIQERYKEICRKHDSWDLHHVLPTLGYAYLLTGEERYWDYFIRPVKEFQKGGRFAKMVRPSGFRTTGCDVDWGNVADRALEEERDDREPPEPVADLKAEALGGGKVKLTWSAPAGDPARYQVKWADKPMLEKIGWRKQAATHANWWAAENVAGEPPPAAGRQEMTVEKVSPGKRFFGIRSWDAASNRSAISNMAGLEVK
ncbi:MAG: hypothetical protein ACYTGB_17700, partial [Planctomycetota bacterium]